MSRVYFISDLHLGHEGVLRWAKEWREGYDIHNHDQILIDKINSVVSKRDLLYVLGDITLGNNHLHYMGQIPCRKILVRGNHDDRHVNEYQAYFEEVHGIINYKGYWLSHAPIHPFELRGRKNIHGHVHQHSITVKPMVDTPKGKWPTYSREILYDLWDRNYINVCAEVYNGYPIPMQDIIDNSYWNKKRI